MRANRTYVNAAVCVDGMKQFVIRSLGRDLKGAQQSEQLAAGSQKTEDRRRKTEGFLSVVRGPWSVVNKAIGQRV